MSICSTVSDAFNHLFITLFDSSFGGSVYYSVVSLIPIASSIFIVISFAPFFIAMMSFLIGLRIS